MECYIIVVGVKMEYSAAADACLFESRIKYVCIGCTQFLGGKLARLEWQYLCYP